MKRALLVIAKRPSPGQTKTRLSPPLSPERAVALYEAFLRDTLDITRQVPDVTRFVLYLPEKECSYFQALAPDFALLPQNGNSLGARLDNALTACLKDGFGQAVVMDSDSPTLPSAYIQRAFESLEGAEVVLGPTEDGGYYLIGLTRPQPHLLRGVTMSTPTVLRDTLALADEANLRVELLPSWYDVDTAADLRRLEQDVRHIAPDRAQYTRQVLRGSWR